MNQIYTLMMVLSCCFDDQTVSSQHSVDLVPHRIDKILEKSL